MCIGEVIGVNSVDVNLQESEIIQSKVQHNGFRWLVLGVQYTWSKCGHFTRVICLQVLWFYVEFKVYSLVMI